MPCLLSNYLPYPNSLYFPHPWRWRVNILDFSSQMNTNLHSQITMRWSIVTTPFLLHSTVKNIAYPACSPGLEILLSRYRIIPFPEFNPDYRHGNYLLHLPGHLGIGHSMGMSHTHIWLHPGHRRGWSRGPPSANGVSPPSTSLTKDVPGPGSTRGTVGKWRGGATRNRKANPRAITVLGTEKNRQLQGPKSSLKWPC